MGYLTGTDAGRVVDYVRENLVSILETALNAAPYADTLEKTIHVLADQAKAATCYGNKEAFVWVNAGATPKPEEWGSTRHYELAFAIDMCMSAVDAEAEDPGGEAQADRLLVNAASDAIRSNYATFEALNIYEVALSAGTENQLGGGMRNPHTFTCMVGTQ